MSLISLRDVFLAFGGPWLLEGVNLQIERGERVCLLGRNGTGKSTLLKLIHGELSPDRGDVWRSQDIRTAYLSQAVPLDLSGSIHEVVARGFEHNAPGDAWQHEHQIEKVLSQLNLDGTAESSALSAGLKRRVLLAQGLVREPDLLLLDEPTNHLDIESIAFLEDFLLRYGGTLLFVTHDRSFIRRLATRVIELDRGRLSDWNCDYDTYLVRKEEALENEAVERALFDKKLAKEEVWIRQGIKARRTRNEGRVRALESMRRLRSERRERTGQVRMAAQDADRSGQIVIETKHVNYAYGKRPIIRDLTTTIMRGDKVGIIGPNGSGKTTLLRLLLGELEPQKGTVRHGTRLSIAYYDQLRAQLDEDQTAFENIAQGKDHVVINGEPRHVIGYLQEFLFEPERARLAVNVLSGGERNRLMLARLFTRPANVIVLDEPTNDLDVDTLELLEELLIGYEGTLLIVSHDRAFLNNVVTSVFALEGDGTVGEYAGGYEDWQRQRRAQSATNESAAGRGEKSKGEPGLRGLRAGTQGTRRLSYKEQRARDSQQRELEALPPRIETLEAEQHALAQTIANPEFYKQPAAHIVKTNERIEALAAELASAYARWEELEKALAEPSLPTATRAV